VSVLKLEVRKMTVHVYRAGRIRKLKEGVNLAEYLTKHPDAYKIHKPPSVATLEEWNNDGGCEALDGCWVEPDGTCPHDKPSWLMAMGLI